MKKNVILICLAILLGVLAVNLNILYADNMPYPKDNPKEDLAPNEVCVYTDVGFMGYELCWEVNPGRRYVLVNKLPPVFRNKISSIRLGYMIDCFIFRNAYFTDNRLFIDVSIADLNEVIPYHGFTGKYEYNMYNWTSYNDDIESIIIMWENVGYLGVTLFENESGDVDLGHSQLFPLPESRELYSTKKIPLKQEWMKNIQAVRFYGYPLKKNVFVDLYDVYGNVLTLSPKDDEMPSGPVKLEPLWWNNNRVKTIRVYTTPPPQIEKAVPKTSPQQDKTADTSNLASMLAKKIPDLSGPWKSNIGLVYKISQKWNEISYQDPMMHKPVNGTVAGKTVTVSWMEGNSLKELKGTIIAIEGENNAKTISWANGVIFNKLKIYPAMTTTPSQPPQHDKTADTSNLASMLAKKIPELSGTWNSSIGLVYNINQNGNKISYQDPMMHKPVNGTVDGKTVTVSWMEGNNQKELIGTITSMESDTRAKTISWANGVIFNKVEKSPTVTATPSQPSQVDMAKGSIPIDSFIQYPDLSGTWNSNIGLVYEISQNKDKISYQDPMMHKPVNGTIDGKTVTVSWMEGNAVKIIKGTTTSVSNDGVAKRIEWQNSVVFHR